MSNVPVRHSPDHPRGSSHLPVARRDALSERAAHRLFRPIPIAPLVYFRIVFGVLMVLEVERYLGYGWVQSAFLDGDLHFKYFGFGWVEPWPGDWLYVHFVAMGVLGAMIAIGALYRVAAALFFLAFSYTFLLDEANYLNHLYLVCLLAFLLVFLPANRARSLDALIRPSLRADRAPAWTLLLLLFQIGVVYVFGGIAKLNADWLQGEPIRMWMQRRSEFPLIGGLLASDAGAYLLCYGGLLFDLLIVPALLWRRTRAIAWGAALIFHLSNAVLFNIGIFPWMMIATLPLFLPIEWWERANQRWIGPPAGSVALAVPGWTASRKTTALLLGGYAAVQLLLPVRHWLYPGSVHWTEQGHRFSWHMKLRSKGGTATFVVTHPRLVEPDVVDPRDFLTLRQSRKMPTHPDMVLQAAHHIATIYARNGYPGAEVRAHVEASLNGRPPRPLIDPGVNLAAEHRSLLPAHWIVPLDETLPPGGDRDRVAEDSD